MSGSWLGLGIMILRSLVMNLKDFFWSFSFQMNLLRFEVTILETSICNMKIMLLWATWTQNILKWERFWRKFVACFTIFWHTEEKCLEKSAITSNQQPEEAYVAKSMRFPKNFHLLLLQHTKSSSQFNTNLIYQKNFL